MKYLIILGDGMADRKIPSLGNKTPLMAADKKNIDKLASKSKAGMVQTIPEGMEPGSGPANMSVMGYAPSEFYTGRSPLEAVSLGIDMTTTDTAYRTNLVSLDLEEGAPYESATMKDYSSGEISTAESTELMKAIEEALGDDIKHFFPGRSYRHCLIWENGPLDITFTPPHDITGKPVANHLPKGDRADIILDMMKKSYEILKNHPINVERRKKGLNTADSIWLWGQGTKPATPDFTEEYGLKGAMISAVDLLFGLARCSGLEVIEVDGATGTKETNFKGKADAAIDAFKRGVDYVYVHLEATDECGHQGDTEGKVFSIERIDDTVYLPIYEYLENNRKTTGEDYHIMILPDHPTPIEIRTHAPDAVPFMLYKSENEKNGPDTYDEDTCAASGVFFDNAPALFKDFMKNE